MIETRRAVIVVLAVLAVMLIAASVFAQGTAPGDRGNRPGGMLGGQRWADLGLTEKQRADMQAIMTQYRPKMQEIQTSSATPEEKKTKLDALRKEMRAKIEAILTPEQKAKMAAANPERPAGTPAVPFPPKSPGTPAGTPPPPPQGRQSIGIPGRLLEQLNLTLDQKTKIEAIQKDARAKIEAIQKDTNQKTLALLTAEQRAQLEKLRNAPRPPRRQTGAPAPATAPAATK